MDETIFDGAIALIPDVSSLTDKVKGWYDQLNGEEILTYGAAAGLVIALFRAIKNMGVDSLGEIVTFVANMLAWPWELVLSALSDLMEAIGVPESIHGAFAALTGDWDGDGKKEGVLQEAGSVAASALGLA